jgi:hypothetical protein
MLGLFVLGSGSARVAHVNLLAAAILPHKVEGMKASFSCDKGKALRARSNGEVPSFPPPCGEGCLQTRTLGNSSAVIPGLRL